MKPAFVRLFRDAPRAMLATVVVSLAISGLGRAEVWLGTVFVDSSNFDEVDLAGNATVRIAGPPTVTRFSFGNEAAGITNLTLNNDDTVLHTFQSLSATTIAAGPNRALHVGGSANFRTGVLSSGGFSNVQLVKSSGTGELIIDGLSSSGDLGGTQLSVLGGTMSIEGSAGVNPIASLGAALLINGSTGILRFGSTSGAGTVFNNNVVANQSGTLEHTTATADTLGGSLLVASGQTLTANVTGGSLAVNGTFVGNLMKTGGGVLRLAGTSSTGTLAVNAGRLEFTGQATLSGAPTIGAGATLALLLATGNSVPSSFALSAGTLEFVPGGIGSATVSLTGGGVRLAASAGAASFTNAVTATGSSAIDVTGVAAELTSLTLQPGVVLTKTGTQLTATGLVFNGAGTYTINSSGSDFKIPGAGAIAASLVKTGAGVLEITSLNTSAATTAVSAGTLRVGDGASLPSGAITDNGVLEFNRSTTLTVANAITGTGAVTKTGAGTLNLNGAQAYAVLNANAGTTNVNGAFTAGTAVVNANATTNFSASQKLAALNIGAGAVVTFAAVPPPFAGDGKAFQSAPSSVPEPGAMSLLLTGALGALLRRRRG